MFRANHGGSAVCVFARQGNGTSPVAPVNRHAESAAVISNCAGQQQRLIKWWTSSKIGHAVAHRFNADIPLQRDVAVDLPLDCGAGTEIVAALEGQRRSHRIRGVLEKLAISPGLKCDIYACAT